MSKEIADLLFPPVEKKESDGEVIYIDRSISAKIISVLDDIDGGLPDDITITNLESCLETLEQVKKLISKDIEENSFDKNGYYIVGM